MSRNRTTMSLYDIIFPGNRVCVMCWKDPEGLAGVALNEEVLNQIVEWCNNLTADSERYSPLAELMKEYSDMVVVNRVKKVSRKTSDMVKRDRIGLWRGAMNYQIVAVVRRRKNGNS